MQLFIFEAIVDGFGANETDLPTRLAQDPAQAAVFTSQIIDQIVDVLRSPDAGAALSVAGHADRDDTVGLSHIQHLKIEREASEKRMFSALATIHQLVQLQEPTAPSDLNTLSFFDVHLRAPGAGVLEEDAAALSEAQRQKNRRIQARLLVFKP